MLPQFFIEFICFFVRWYEVLVPGVQLILKFPHPFLPIERRGLLQGNGKEDHRHGSAAQKRALCMSFFPTHKSRTSAQTGHLFPAVVRFSIEVEDRGVGILCFPSDHVGPRCIHLSARYKVSILIIKICLILARFNASILSYYY